MTPDGFQQLAWDDAAVEREPANLLDRRIYGMAQVDWMLKLPPGTARRWIDGYTRGSKHYEPIVRAEATGDDVVTWGEFAEARLLAEYRSKDVPIVRMRPAVEALRESFRRKYPLAYAAPFLEESGRELVMRIEDHLNLERSARLVVVRNGQMSLAEPAQTFVDSAHFGKTGAIEWLYPDPRFKEVKNDPRRQFGIAVVRSVPTSVIAELVAGGDSPAMIAELYELTEGQVTQAIGYELERGRQARAAA